MRFPADWTREDWQMFRELWITAGRYPNASAFLAGSFVFAYTAAADLNDAAGQLLTICQSGHPALRVAVRNVLRLVPYVLPIVQWSALAVMLIAICAALRTRPAPHDKSGAPAAP